MTRQAQQTQSVFAALALVHWHVSRRQMLSRLTAPSVAQP